MLFLYLHTFPLELLTSRLRRFLLYSRKSVFCSYSVLFLTVITNSHDNPLFSTRFNLSHILTFFFTHTLYVPLATFFRSWVNARFPFILSHALTHHYEHSVLTHVCANKIPDKPPNLFAGNCPQILGGKIKFYQWRDSTKFERPLCCCSLYNTFQSALFQLCPKFRIKLLECLDIFVIHILVNICNLMFRTWRFLRYDISIPSVSI